MFSTLSSYIWGDETETAAPAVTEEAAVKAVRDPSPDDWILVGESSGPAPGNLSGGLPPLPGDSTPSQSSSNSSEAGDAVAAAEPAAAAVGVKHRSHCSVANVTKKEMKGIKSSQLIKQKNSGKALTSKALNKHNKTVYANNSKKHHVKQNLNIKMAGANKNLKQC